MKRIVLLVILALGAFYQIGCDEVQPTSDQKQQDAQELLLQEGTAQTGMPAIKNFRERKLLKEILEMRDQASLTTFTYTYAENTGKRIFLCHSLGFGLPYATQYTSPEKMTRWSTGCSFGYQVLPQADPNGLFSPSSAEGTWVMCKDPNGPDVRPVYVEPRVIVSPFPLDDDAAAVEVPVTTIGAKGAK